MYDRELESYCYARLRRGRFASTGVRISDPPPDGIVRHLQEDGAIREKRRRDRFEAMLAPEHRAGPPGAMLTFGPSGGLLPGRRLSEGNVVGLTILITFPDTPSTVTPADVDALLNPPTTKPTGTSAR